MSVGTHPNGPVSRARRGEGEKSPRSVVPALEANPMHRQFLHPHVLLDLARDPPPARTCPGTTTG
jgi:hypothetical protein